MRTIFLMLLVAGCADAAQSKSDTYFPSYQGKPIGMVIARFGAPSSEATLSDGTIYTWREVGCRLEAHASVNGNAIGLKSEGDSCAPWMDKLK